MRRLLLAGVVCLFMTSLMLTAVNVSAESPTSGPAETEGVFPDRTFFVTRSPPGGPRSDTAFTDIAPTWSGFWRVKASQISGSGILVEVYQSIGGASTFVGASKLRSAGDESVPVRMMDGEAYQAFFTPFGKQGTSILSERFTAPQPPSVYFTYVPANPMTREIVSFDASTTTDPDSGVASYDWDFGDQGTASGIMVDHAYTAAGTYTVTLTVTDTSGLSNSTAQEVRVGGNLAPVASFEVTRTLMMVEVDASASDDPDGDMIENYQWLWGDDQSESTGTNPTATHTYTSPGKYAILLRVTDPFDAMGEASREVSVNTYTVDWTYTDFFNVPYGEWWDMRLTWAGGFGDRPIGAECFSAEGIAAGFCTPTDDMIPDVASFPYTNWNPTPVGDAIIAAPYGFQADLVNHPAYTIDRPVIVPTCGELAALLAPAGITYSCAAPETGGQVSVDLMVDYTTSARMEELSTVRGCTDVRALVNGLLTEVRLTVTMDGIAARRLFGVTDPLMWNPGPADTSLLSAGCGSGASLPPDPESGKLEKGLAAWFLAQGNGPYAIYNAFGDEFKVWSIEATASYNSATGMHTLTVDMPTWGAEVLAARWFYWGAAPYVAGVAGAPPAGWSGMEAPWFEALHLTGTIGADFDATVTGVQQNHFRHLADAGPDGFFDTVDDVPKWVWEPVLADRLYSFAPNIYSELDAYLGHTYVHTTAASTRFGIAEAFDYVPAVWELKVGETQTFWFPTVPVVLYNPFASLNLDDPSGLAAMSAIVTLAYSVPSTGAGIYDPSENVLRVAGPTIVGAVPTTGTGRPLESRPSYNLVSD